MFIRIVKSDILTSQRSKSLSGSKCKCVCLSVQSTSNEEEEEAVVPNKQLKFTATNALAQTRVRHTHYV